MSSNKGNISKHYLLRALAIWVSTCCFILLSTPMNLDSLIKVGIIVLVILVALIAFRKKLNTFKDIKISYWCVALFIVVALAIQFCTLNYKFDYNSITNSIFHLKWLYIMLLIAFFLMIIGLASCAYWLKFLIEDVFKINETHIQKCKKLFKPTIIFSLIFSVSIISIIRANYNYVDDMGRALIGYKSWGSSSSRFLSDFFANFLHCNLYLSDISPLPQLIAMIIMAIACVTVILIFKRSSKFRFIDYCAVIPIAISPYFLECISYKYDSPYMALSILAAVAPLLICSSNNKKINSTGLFIASILSTLVVCLTYQVSAGILPMLTIILCAYNLISDQWKFKEARNVFGITAFGYIAGIVFFKLIFMNSVNEYVDTSIPALEQLIPVTISNYQQYFSLLIKDFNLMWLGLVFVCVLNFIVSFTFKRKGNKIVSIALALIIVVITALMMFGLYPIMSSPIFSPRAMYGVGAWLAFMNISAVNMIHKSKILFFGRVFVCVLAWVFFVFSFTYGNALNAQKDYINEKENAIAADISNITNDGNKREIQIHGSAGYSPVTQNNIKEYPILERLIRCTLKEDWAWGVYQLENYHNLPLTWDSETRHLDTFAMKCFKKTFNYDLYYDDKYIVVDLHNHSFEDSIYNKLK